MDMRLDEAGRDQPSADIDLLALRSEIRLNGCDPAIFFSVLKILGPRGGVAEGEDRSRSYASDAGSPLMAHLRIFHSFQNPIR